MIGEPTSYTPTPPRRNNNQSMASETSSGSSGIPPTLTYRGRSGSFNPTILTSKPKEFESEKSHLARERSYTDVNSLHPSLAYIRSRRLSVISAESIDDFDSIFDESDLETVQV